MVSRIAVPAVITSSMMITRSPSLRLVADDIAAFAMVLGSLRLKKNGLSMP